MRHFASFAAIDWSGAVGEYLPGIAVARTSGAGRVDLVTPPRGWSREGVRTWLLQLAGSQADTLIGVDLSLGFPFSDTGAYFPGWAGSPPDAKALWALTDQLAQADVHLAVSSVVAHPDIAPHFRQRGMTGAHFVGSMGRLRVTEHGQAAMGLRPYSCFNLVGAAQVGKSSLTGMRMLHGLRGRLPVWPFDPLPATGPAIVEIYTSLAALQAGRRAGRTKMRTAPALHDALAALESYAQPPAPLTDHASDALVTAAWLRRVAGNDSLWRPAAMSASIAATEGWTFGVP